MPVYPVVFIKRRCKIIRIASDLCAHLHSDQNVIPKCTFCTAKLSQIVVISLILKMEIYAGFLERIKCQRDADKLLLYTVKIDKALHRVIHLELYCLALLDVVRFKAVAR